MEQMPEQEVFTPEDEQSDGVFPWDSDAGMGWTIGEDS